MNTLNRWRNNVNSRCHDTVRCGEHPTSGQEAATTPTHLPTPPPDAQVYLHRWRTTGVTHEDEHHYAVRD